MKVLLIAFLYFAQEPAGTLCQDNNVEHFGGAEFMIAQWNEFLAGRWLDEEEASLNMAFDTFTTLNRNMEPSLSHLVQYQYQELDNALIQTTSVAEVCLRNLNGTIHEAIAQGVEMFKTCSWQANSKLTEMKETLAEKRDELDRAYQRALSAIKSCAQPSYKIKTQEKRRECEDNAKHQYFRVSNDTSKYVSRSPSYTFFKENVVACASASASYVTEEGKSFLQDMQECSKLDRYIRLPNNLMEGWTGFEDTLAKPMSDAMERIKNRTAAVDEAMKYIYKEVETAADLIAGPLKDSEYYADQSSRLLEVYNETVDRTYDDLGESECTEGASNCLGEITNKYEIQAAKCDRDLEDKLHLLVVEIIAHFKELKGAMLKLGNGEVLNCFRFGFVFAPNLIRDCTNLLISKSDLIAGEVLNPADSDLHLRIQSLMKYYKLDSCNDYAKTRAKIMADSVLFRLQHCIYARSTSPYSVITPRPLVPIADNETVLSTASPLVDRVPQEVQS